VLEATWILIAAVPFFTVRHFEYNFLTDERTFWEHFHAFHVPALRERT